MSSLSHVFLLPIQKELVNNPAPMESLSFPREKERKMIMATQLGKKAGLPNKVG